MKWAIRFIMLVVAGMLVGLGYYAAFEPTKTNMQIVFGTLSIFNYLTLLAMEFKSKRNG